MTHSKGYDRGSNTLTLTFCFSFGPGGRDQRRRKWEDRASWSSGLLHGPHPCEVTRVSPAVAAQLPSASLSPNIPVLPLLDNAETR